MNQNIVKTELIRSLTKFVSAHPCVSFQYGYDKVRKCFLVSYLILHKSEETNSDKFWTDLLCLQENLMGSYGENAPLFCEEESLFKLPSDFETIQCNAKASEEKIDIYSYSRSKRVNRASSLRYPIANV